MKSVTPIISVILLIMLTIAASVSAYFFISSSVADIEEGEDLSAFEDTSLLRIVSLNGSRVIVRNEGLTPVDEVVFTLNGEVFNYTFTNPISDGEVAEIYFSPQLAGQDLEIKIFYGTQKVAEYTSPASSNTVDSGFITADEPEGCSIVFSDSTPPSIEIIAFSSVCRYCINTPKQYLNITLRITDDIPIRDVLYENNGASNFSLIPKGINGLYEAIIYADSIIDGTHDAYAIDWLNNTLKINLGSTPLSLYSVGCSSGGCNLFDSPEIESFNHSNEICYGDKIMVNSTYNSLPLIPKKVLIELYYPNVDEGEVAESFYLENLDEENSLSWGGFYYPKMAENYELVMSSYSLSGVSKVTLLGNLTVNND